MSVQPAIRPCSPSTRCGIRPTLRRLLRNKHQNYRKAFLLPSYLRIICSRLLQALVIKGNVLTCQNLNRRSQNFIGQCHGSDSASPEASLLQIAFIPKTSSRLIASEDVVCANYLSCRMRPQKSVVKQARHLMVHVCLLRSKFVFEFPRSCSPVFCILTNEIRRRSCLAQRTL